MVSQGGLEALAQITAAGFLLAGPYCCAGVVRSGCGKWYVIPCLGHLQTKNTGGERVLVVHPRYEEKYRVRVRIVILRLSYAGLTLTPCWALAAWTPAACCRPLQASGRPSRSTADHLFNR